MCPVGGTPVNFVHRVETADGHVFFCCPHCVERYRADPSASDPQVAVQREVLGALPRVQVSCPVTGNPVDDSAFEERPDQYATILVE